MINDIEKVLISEEELQNKVAQLGEQLSHDYKDRFPLAIGILKGAMLFMGRSFENEWILFTLKWTLWMFPAMVNQLFRLEK